MDNIFEIESALAEAVQMRNDEYKKQFDDARMKQAAIVYKNYVNAHPRQDGESDEEYTKRANEYVLDQMSNSPDELTRQLRIVAQWQTNLFILMREITGALQDFRDLYTAVNRQKIEAYAKTVAKRMADKGEDTDI